MRRSFIYGFLFAAFIVAALGATSRQLVTIDDTAYDATSWNGNLDAATKNAIRDKIETISAGGGAPTDATYITQTANGTLSAEQALSSLSTGIMRVATTTGAITSLTDSSGISGNISDETGSGALVFATSPTLVTPILGTPTSGTLTNCTLPVGGITGLGTGVGTFLATPSSANLASAVTNETGSGALVFGTTPTFTTSVLFGSAGVQVSDDGDGALTFLGLGNGSDEDLTMNLDDTSNTVVFTSSTSLATANWSGIALQESGNAVPNATDTLAFFASTTSAQLAGVLSDESGGSGTFVLTGLTASTTQAGIAEIATAAEVNTGSDTGRVLGVNEFRQSNAAKRLVTMPISPDMSTAMTTGDGKGFYYRVPAELNGFNLIAVAASCDTVSSSGIPTFQIRRVRSGTPADMLTTKLTIDASENDSSTAAAAAVIDTANDDVATADRIYFDCDVSGTGCDGVEIHMVFQLP